MGNLLCVLLGWLVPSFCETPSPSPPQVVCHWITNKVDCESSTNTLFGTTCNWASCSQGGSTCPNNNDENPRCMTPIPGDQSCADLTTKGEELCTGSYEQDNELPCDWLSNACTSCSVCNVVDQRRLFSKSHNDMLFASLLEQQQQQQDEHDGGRMIEEWMKLQQLYNDDLHAPDRRGICENPRSPHHGRSLSMSECLNSNNNRYLYDDEDEEDVVEDEKLDEERYDKLLPSWASPNISTIMNGGIQLLASNPGIWYHDNFLNKNEIASMQYLSNKYGKEMGMYGPCRYANHRMNAHPNSGKQCFKMSTEKVCNGPYRSSKCDGTVTNPKDSAIVERLFQKVQSLWSTTIDPEPHIKFQLTDPGTIPMHLHHDHRTITFMIYLTNGGAGTVFPNVNVTIPPKAGAAATWLNYNQDGKRNPLADHAVQAHPTWAGERLSVAVELRSKTPQHFLESQF